MAHFKKEILMVEPTYFDVKYVINPFMQKGTSLPQIDTFKAKRQWEELKNTYEKLGCRVHTLEGEPELPDMVFAANQSLPYLDVQNKEPSVVLSKMAHPERQPEVPFFKAWYESRGYQIKELSIEISKMEGNGDVLLHPHSDFFWGAIGPRTEKTALREIESITNRKGIFLPLEDSRFYHLDTCFSILSEHTVALVREAFSEDTLELIKHQIKHVLPISIDEALDFFSGNCHSVDGKHVLLQRGAIKFPALLREHGFTPIEVDTGEYMKSGGSVFCLKMELP